MYATDNLTPKNARYDFKNLPDKVFLILTLLLLGGCSTFTKPKLDIALSDLNWQARGKLSIVSPDENATGYLTWSQLGNAFDIYLAGPFGSGATRIMGNQDSAAIKLPGMKQPQIAPSAEELLLRYTGWNFPVSEIRYWLTGAASPNYSAETIQNEAGQLVELQQFGWRVRFSRYQEHNNRWLPGLIKISQGPYRFTFAIRQWQWGQDTQQT